MSLDGVVSVTITKESAAVSQAGFGTPLLLTYHTEFPERARVFGNDLAELTSAGFATTSPTYKMAQALLSQNPKVSQYVVGRRALAPTQVTRCEVVNVVNEREYTVAINASVFTFTSDASATAAEIAAGLVAAIGLGSEPVTASDNLDGTFDLTADVAGDMFDLVVDRVYITRLDRTVDPGVTTDLGEVRLVNDDWYCVLLDSNGSGAGTAGEIENLAAAVEPINRLFVAGTADDEVTGVSSTDVVSRLPAYDYTAVLWHQKPHTYAQAAWAGDRLPTDPGTSTWAYKSLAGIEVSTLSTAEQTNLRNKSANFYISIAGVPVTIEGYTTSGEFIDVTRLLDETAARIQEQVFGFIQANEKVPFTNAGILGVKNQVQSVLDARVPFGYAPDPAPEVTAPDVADVSAADKTSRTLRNVVGEAVIAGAIHKVFVNLNVTF